MIKQNKSIDDDCADDRLFSSPERYDSFAWFYDKYWGRDIVEDFAGVVRKIFIPNLKSHASVLDLCCGTGLLAAELEHLGLEVTGLDASHEMLRFAAKNTRSAKFFQADARHFNVSRRFDGVVSTFDSLNHMLNLKDLESVFRNVAQALEPDGLFHFDMNLERGFRLHWQEEFSVVQDDAVCVLRGSFDRTTRLGTYNFTVFRPDGDSWGRSDFSICQRPYRRNQIERLLKNAGFVDVVVYDARKDLAMPDHDGRVFITAKTPG